MFTTFFGCYFTEIKVVPANWKETGKKGPSALISPGTSGTGFMIRP
jgi:hypothetical protein